MKQTWEVYAKRLELLVLSMVNSKPYHICIAANSFVSGNQRAQRRAPADSRDCPRCQWTETARTVLTKRPKEET
jgi:hypothetical protein